MLHEPSRTVQIALVTNQSSACTAGGQPAINVKVCRSVADAELAVRGGNVSTFCAGFRKDDRQLATAVQNGIQRLVNDGTCQRIFDQYGLGQAKLTADEVTIDGARS